MDIRENISQLLGRNVEIVPVVFKGMTGFIPLYLNHEARNSVSEFFAPSEEECLTKFLQFLKKNGDQNATNSDSERRPSSEN